MIEVESPVVVPSNGGLLSVVPLMSGEPHLFYEGVHYLGQLCGHNRVVPEYPNPKTFDQLPWIKSETFRTYRGIEESMFEWERTAAATQGAYDAGKSWAIERGVQLAILNGTDDYTPVDLTPTPGTPVTNRRAALGILQQHAADTYSGLPMIHTNRHGAELLCDRNEDGKLFTIQDVPIANGGGYGPVGPGGMVAPAGTAWAYVTGQVHVWEQAYAVEQTHSLEENRHYALAEGTYLAAVDCFVAAILVGSN